MKKILFNLTLLIATAGVLNGQYLVSTEPSKRTFLLEEFTGQECPNCVKGINEIVKLKSEFPGRIIPIAYHDDSHDGEDVKLAIPQSDSIGKLLKAIFLPSASISRNDSSFLVEEWRDTIVKRIDELSPVNLSARSSLNRKTRQLTVQVEAYYTADGFGKENFLHIALVQNNIVGTQSLSQLDTRPLMNMGRGRKYYRLQHVFRQLSPSLWGDTLKTIKQGTHIQKTYQIAIPDSMGKTKSPAYPEDLEVIAFITRGKKEVETAVYSEIVRTEDYPDYGRILLLDENHYPVVGRGAVDVYFLNNGTHPVVSLDFKYATEGGEPKNYRWSSRTIDPQRVDTIRIPFDLTDNVQSKLSLSIQKINDKNVEALFVPQTIEVMKRSVKTELPSVGKPDSLILDLRKSMSYGLISFQLSDADGKIIIQGKNNAEYTGERLAYAFKPEKEGWYRLELRNKLGHGMDEGSFAWVQPHSNKVIDESSTDNFFLREYFIQVTQPLSIVKNSLHRLQVSPNPVIDHLRFEGDAEEIHRLELLDANGQSLFILSPFVSNGTLDMSPYAAGIYFLKIHTSSGIEIYKLLKK